jgi:hypothetical protein
VNTLPNEIEPFHLSTKEVKQISARSKGKRRRLIAGLAAIGLEAAKRFQFDYHVSFTSSHPGTPANAYEFMDSRLADHPRIALPRLSEQ